MAQTPVGPFDNVESAYQYIGLLCEAVDEAAQMIDREMTAATALAGARHLDALRLVDHKLRTLREHLVTSRRLLGDLRTLRRFLLDERATDRAESGETRVDSFERQSAGQV